MRMQGLAVAWYRAEDWSRWCALCPDFQPDYQHWLQRSEQAFTAYQGAGAPVLKVVIKPEEFLTWTSASGRGIGQQARAEFAAAKLMDLDAAGNR